MKEYSTLGIVLLKRCSSSCLTCCFGCLPSDMEELEVDKIKTLIDETKDFPDIKHVSFTGGEVFLRFDDFLELTEYSSKKGLRVSCVTNGYWAKSLEKAIEKLALLKEKGLSVLNISFDEYHLEYIEAENINNAMIAAEKLNLPTLVNIAVEAKESGAKIVDMFSEKITNLTLKISPLLPAGKAKNLPKEIFKRNIENIGLRCPFDRVFTVLYDGFVYPCCSIFVKETALKVANINTSNLTEIFRKIKNNALLYILRNRTFDALNDVAAQLGFDVPKYVSSPCEVCATYFCEENIMKFAEYIKKEAATV